MLESKHSIYSIGIMGGNYEMVVRTCAAPNCAQTWKCLPTSAYHYCSRPCQPGFDPVKADADERELKAKSGRGRKQTPGAIARDKRVLELLNVPTSVADIQKILFTEGFRKTTGEPYAVNDIHSLKVRFKKKGKLKFVSPPVVAKREIKMEENSIETEPIAQETPKPVKRRRRRMGELSDENVNTSTRLPELALAILHDNTLSSDGKIRMLEAYAGI